jgi:hypothetical protein
MHFSPRSTQEVRVAEKCGLGAVLYMEVDEERQDPQDGSVPPGRPYMKGGAEKPLT